MRENENKSAAIVVQGFLLKSGERTITVLPLDLEAKEFPREVEGFGEKEALRWTEIPFARVASEYLTGLKEEEMDSWRASRSTMGLRMGRMAQAFVVAYACWEKGHPEQARAIYEAAGKVPPWNIGDRDLKANETLRAGVERELAHAATWRAILAFDGSAFGMPQPEPLASREELLVNFRSLQKNFPKNPHRELVDRVASRLEQMVAEDSAHLVRSPQEIAALPVDEQVREWIFRLRDQNSRQWSQPGHCDIFNEIEVSQNSDSPAYQLARIGYPAVPLLIAALDDERLTRSVGFGRDVNFSHEVLTVSDCARQILNRIARQTFPAGQGFIGTPEEQKKLRADYRVAVERWWNDLERKRE